MHRPADGHSGARPPSRTGRSAGALIPAGPSTGPAATAAPSASPNWLDAWTEPEAIDISVSDLPLPARSEDRWNLATMTAAWLCSRRSPHTRRAYFRDLAHFLSWLTGSAGLDPLRVRRPDLDSYLAALHATSPPPSPATINRRLATLSSWYGHLLDADVAIRNPVAAVDREPVDRDFSPTAGLTVAEVRALLRAADDVVSTRRRRVTVLNAHLLAAAERDQVLLGLLAHLGLRVGEALALRCEDLRHDAGHRTVVIYGEGGRRPQLPVPAALLRLLDPFVTERRRAADRAEGERHFNQKHHELTLALQQRGYRADEARNRSQQEIDAARHKDLARIAAASTKDLAKVPVPGPLLCAEGGNPLTQAAVFATVRRLARAAGLPAADKTSPHSLRHSAATIALDDGAPLRDMQDFLGHADPRTTRRYDRNRSSLDHSPAHRLGGLYAE